MNLANGQQSDYYTQNEQDVGFKCDICALTFRISSERNIHILNHFQKENCSICSETLIRLGNIWYSIREHPDHNVNQNVPDSNVNGSGNEFRLDSVFVDALKSEPDPIYNEQTETQFEDCFAAIDGGPLVKIEEDNTNYQTEFVQVPDYNERKPFNIPDELNKNTDAQETPEDTPMLDNFEANLDESGVSKVKIKGQCHICMKKIVCATSLKSHINLHFGIKPYECELCEKAFTDKRNLNVHKKSCKGKRLLKNKNTKQTSAAKKSELEKEPLRIPDFTDLQQFNITDEPDTDTQETRKKDENFTQKVKTKGQCHICKKKIACATSLKYHMNLHLGIKPFVCVICDKAFADKRNLLRHSRTHPSQSTPNISNREQNKKTKQSNTADESKLDEELRCTPDIIEHESLDEVDEAGIIEHESSDEVDDTGINVELKDTPMHNDFQRNEDTIVMPKIEIKGQCHICMKKISPASSLQYHLNVHFGVKPYPCEFCDKPFADKRNLIRHRKMHTKVLTTEDDMSNTVVKDFYDDDNLAARESANTDWVCEYCNTDFKLEINLAKHILKDHDDKKSEHSCNICVEKFSSLVDLLAHMRAHPESAQYKCTFDGCNHGFAYKAKLSSHLGKHRLIDGHITRKTQDDVRTAMMQHAALRLTGLSKSSNGVPDEDATCNICSKKYSSRALMQQHIQTAHNNERIKCLAEGCDKIFKGKTTAITKHIQIHHPELIRECETCKKVFYSEAKLVEHQRVHNSFACNLCSQTFTFKHRLVAHINSHEKEAKCDICNKRFTCVKRMMIHRQTHESNKIITCRFPGKRKSKPN